MVREGKASGIDLDRILFVVNTIRDSDGRVAGADVLGRASDLINDNDEELELEDIKVISSEEVGILMGEIVVEGTAELLIKTNKGTGKVKVKYITNMEDGEKRKDGLFIKKMR